ncbi:hypothetical protein ACJQWK_05347 [Exserohilum turcicum]|uniref:Carbohydrate esterase family 12 protein n=1 Tax=Exserohilum turcicum (strain 28A) TaxID=671987 RepID=R0JX69_EXST2|nr:carbohydrate esterase family 12 protein [Exserohilum turcica Et28A]EOA82074.1 carbohydrate esterase family 12 protein [Exserohilum turcica Et28A]
MYLNSAFSYLALFASLSTATPVPDPDRRPSYFVLAGDGTTAPQSKFSGGWGDGFLNTCLVQGATGRNFGVNAATTVSYRADGHWAKVLAAAKAAGANGAYIPYVTIQFGHGDQRPENKISMAQFTRNLVQFVKEVKAIPATPILVTPLSKRDFDSSGHVIESLADVTAATKKAAELSHAILIDLNAASTKYLNAIGPKNAHTYNLHLSDNTHLSKGGSIVFGNMMGLHIDWAIARLVSYVRPVKEISQALQHNEFVPMQ